MNRLPNWLRWLLFLPLSLMASILAFALIKLLGNLFNQFFLFQFVLILAGAILIGYIFVRLAELLVPKFKIFFAIFMTLSYGILAWITLIKKVILNNIIQLNSFETICLSGIGTIAAIVACFHSYKNQKRKIAALKDLAKAELDRAASQKLKHGHKDSASASADLENKLMQIISEFDSDAAKPRRTEPAIARSSKPGKLFNVYQHDSHRKKFQKDILISDLKSDDLDKEITRVMTVLESEIGEISSKPLSREYQRSRSPESGKFIVIPGHDLAEPKLKKKKPAPASASQKLDRQISSVIPKLDSNKKEPKRKSVPATQRLSHSNGKDKLSDPLVNDSLRQEKQAPATASKYPEKKALPTPVESATEMKTSGTKILPKEDRLSRVTEPKKSGDVLLSDLFEQILKEEKQIPETDSKDLEQDLLSTLVESIPEKKEPRTEELPTEEQLISVTEPEASGEATPDDLSEQELKAEKRISGIEAEDLKQEFLPTPIESISEMVEPRTEIPSKEHRMNGVSEPEESSDVFPDDLFKHELTEEKLVFEIDSKDVEQEILPAPVESVSEIKESMSEMLSKDDRLSRITEPGESSDASPYDLPKQQLADKRLVLKSKSKIPKENVSPKTPELISVTNTTEEDISKKKDEFEPGTAKLDNLPDADKNASYWQELLRGDHLSYPDLDDFDQQVLHTTTELDCLINESKTYQFTKYVEHYYRSIAEDENIALIHTEIFYLWCMMETVFDFTLDSEFRRKLITFFNTRLSDLYLKWKKFTDADTTQKIAIDFNNFSYYSNQMRTNNIHLNRSFQNTEAEILFGKIVLSKIYENMGNRKIDVDQHTIMMPVEVYYELKQRVIEILNNSTNTICC